jgi:hypothetical protein
MFNVNDSLRFCVKIKANEFDGDILICNYKLHEIAFTYRGSLSIAFDLEFFIDKFKY